jgi:ferric-dicitrate binding protein FerR (iron transport regulator)
MRMELQISSNLQMVLMTRALMEHLERETFERLRRATRRHRRVHARGDALARDVPEGRFHRLADRPAPAFRRRGRRSPGGRAWIDPAVGQQLGVVAGRVLPTTRRSCS